MSSTACAAWPSVCRGKAHRWAQGSKGQLLTDENSVEQQQDIRRSVMDGIRFQLGSSMAAMLLRASNMKSVQELAGKLAGEIQG
jgi:hypothetical protein